MRLQESGEMYLEAIYVLSQKNSKVRSIDVCDYLGYSKPSVSRAMGLLKQAGLVVMDSGDNHLTLTPEGLATAKKIYDRHTVLSAALVKLGVDPETAAEDACKMEHVISDQTLSALQRFVAEK